MQRLWLIGGTQESAELGRSLIQAKVPAVVTVATESARSLYPASPHLEVWVGRLTPEDVEPFLKTHQVCGILDASHPFAAQVSEMAIATAQQYYLPYLRYERDIAQVESKERQNEWIFSDFKTLLETDLLLKERVLLTIGYRSLQLFQPWQAQAVLFARILPSVTALEAAIAAGFTSDRLIALRPPISVELERSLWQQWNISLVITKASGAPGGEVVKRQLAADLGLKLAIVARPVIHYPQQTNEVQVALAFAEKAQRRV